jgi:leucyl-tRNA---protein transferase
MFLNQYFRRRQVSPAEMDALWAAGWRHFGTYFFRYSLALRGGRVCSVLPLRIDLARFAPSRSQRRVLSRNRDLTVAVRDSFVDAAKQELFHRHKRRFRENVPGSLFDFLSAEDAARVPCPNREICVTEGGAGGRLLAVTFLDLGAAATSGVYSIFEPQEERRSLGIFLILEAIRLSRERGCRYFYHGYAYREPSFYDYKKKFSGLEYFDWRGGWKNFSEEAGGGPEESPP